MAIVEQSVKRTFKPAKQCSCCGRMFKASAHLYGPTDFNRRGVKQGSGLCPKCFAKYAVGRTALKGGRSGVTITQLQTAITANIDNPEVLVGLRHQYPQSFDGAVRYLHAADRRTVEALFGVKVATPEYTALVQRLRPKRSGVTGTQVLRGMIEAVENDDRALMAALFTHFPQHVMNQRRYLRVADRAVVNQFISEESAKALGVSEELRSE